MIFQKNMQTVLTTGLNARIAKVAKAEENAVELTPTGFLTVPNVEATVVAASQFSASICLLAVVILPCSLFVINRSFRVIYLRKKHEINL